MSRPRKPTQQYDLLHIYCKRGFKPMLAQLAEADCRSLSAEVQALVAEEYRKRFPTAPKPNLI